MESSFFRHTPISSPGNIRFIELIPSVDKDRQVQCNIREGRSNRWSHPYEALSYVWGRPLKSWPILCNGKEFLVTRNCYEALLFMRQNFRSRTLWVDAICIDQSDTKDALEERTREIPRMGEIYAHAIQTVVWLGPGDDSTPTIFRRIKILAHFNRDRPSTCAKLARLAVGLRSDVESDVFRSRKLRQSFDQIVNHPWFRRAWTAQECAFPQKCIAVCGISTVNLDDIFKFLRFYLSRESNRSMYDLIVLRVILKRRVHFLRSGPIFLSDGPSSLEDPSAAIHGFLPQEFQDVIRPQEFHMLSSMAYLEATVPQDRVYGLHSALRVMGIVLPAPSYGKSLPEICREVASAYIRSRRTLDILCLTLPSSDHDAFPSWVPAWDTPLRLATRWDESGIAIIRQTSKTCRATKSTFAHLTDHCAHELSSYRAHKLEVRGKIMGQIAKKISCGPQSESQLMKGGHEVVTLTCLLWCMMVAETTSYPLPGCDRIRAAYHVMLSHVPKAIERETYEKTYVQFQKWFKKMKVFQNDPRAYGTKRMEEIILQDPDLRYIHLNICQKANYGLFSLDSGHLGMAHYTCKAGDYLVLLAGLSYPLLLRRAFSDEYKIVAPAYCHGMMEGECWDVGRDYGTLETKDLDRLSILTII